MAKQKEFGSCMMVGLGILTDMWVAYEIGKACAQPESFTAILPQLTIFLAINGVSFIGSIEPNDKQ